MRTPKLGELITHNELRDAIHIAVAPVTLHRGDKKGRPRIDPGTPIKFSVQGNTELVEQCDWKDAVGIVDPFLKVTVDIGQHFWMFVMPGTVTGIRHEWEHPAFDEEERATSEWWLREFFASVPSYGELPYEEGMKMLLEEGGVFLGVNINYPTDEQVTQLRHHFKIVTGKDLPEEPEFRCAC